MEIEYTLECLPEETPVRGNALASGDDAEDRAAEDEILAQLDAGNDWAWCTVKVTARVEIDGQTFAGWDYLGCCSYENETDFIRPGGYYQDMILRAKEELIDTLCHEIKRGEIASQVLKEIK